MKKYLIITLLGIVLTGITTSCSDDENIQEQPTNTPGVIHTTANGSSIIECNNKFGIRLLEEVGGLQKYANKNFVISPMSVNYAMSMLANGASDDTRQQIINTMGFNTIDIEELNEYNSKMISQLSNVDPNVTLNFANSIWAKPHISVKDAFISAMYASYNAEVYEINSSSFIKDVNKWCSDNTNGKISEFINEDTPTPDFALYNAIYFKGDWDNNSKFDKANTREDYFTNNGGSRSPVKFMNKEGGVIYYETEKIQNCELVFGRSNFRAAFILPKPDVAMNDAIADLANGGWGKNAETNPNVKVNLSLPKFKINSTVKLVELLTDMGMTDVFGFDADFSLICDNDLHIDYVDQQAFFEIDEDGAEAAAVTGIGMESSLGDSKKITVKYDRPFIFMIYEYTTNSIVFMGEVNSFAD